MSESDILNKLNESKTQELVTEAKPRLLTFIKSFDKLDKAHATILQRASKMNVRDTKKRDKAVAKSNKALDALKKSLISLEKTLE